MSFGSKKQVKNCNIKTRTRDQNYVGWVLCLGKPLFKAIVHMTLIPYQHSKTFNAKKCLLSHVKNVYIYALKVFLLNTFRFDLNVSINAIEGIFETCKIQQIRGFFFKHLFSRLSFSRLKSYYYCS